MSGHTELTGIAIVGLAALVCGMVMTRFRQPAVVGYILAGVLLGPTAAGLVENEAQIRLLADLGILMLLFMIGMELPVQSFMKVWRTALLVTAGQIAGFLAITFILAEITGWPPAYAALLAFAAALSSTAVAIKMIDDIGETDTDTGSIAVAVLIAQDLAVVPMMLFLGDLGGEGFSTAGVAKVTASAVVLTLLVVFFAKKGSIRLPMAEWVAARPELRPVAALALCFAAAAAAGLVGVSAAYGAFLAGLVLGNAEGMKNLTEAAKPIEGLLMMVFFLSVGLLIDFNFIWEHLGQVILWLAVVTVVKTILNILLFRVCGQPWPRAFLAGVLLGQVGEFSFLLAAVGTDAGIMPVTENDLVVAVVALSLLISPLWLAAARRLQEVAARRRRTFRSLLSYLLGIDLGAAFAGTGRRIGTAFKATAKASGGAVAGLGNLVPGRNRRATPKRRKRRRAAAEARPSERETDKADDA